MKRLILFSNSYLDSQFRRLVNHNQKEIGGYFITVYEPKTWPGKFSWREFKRVMLSDSCSSARFVESIILIPNQSKQPSCEWTAWDYRKTKDLAEQTARLVGGHAIHFHSHPNGNGEPSTADLTYAASYCQLWEGYSEFIVVTGTPLRLHYYELDTHMAALPEEGANLDRGEFISWRSLRLRGLVH